MLLVKDNKSSLVSLTVTWIERDLQFVKLIPLYSVKMHFSMALVRYNIKKYVFFGSPRDMLHTWSCSLSVSFSSLRVVICPCSDINWSDWLPIRENIIRRNQCWCKLKKKHNDQAYFLKVCCSFHPIAGQHLSPKQAKWAFIHYQDIF